MLILYLMVWRCVLGRLFTVEPKYTYTQISCPRDYHLPMKSNRAFVRNLGDGDGPRYSCHCDVRVPWRSVICKTWTGTLTNSTDPEQTPQNAASDQGLQWLLKLQEVRVKWNSLKSPFRTIFLAYTQWLSTHQCCQCFDWHLCPVLLTLGPAYAYQENN